MGRRWGKTVMGGTISLAHAKNGAKCAWIVPTYRNSRPLWRWAMQGIYPARRAKLVETNKTDLVISFPLTGGFLGIYTADNDDAIRGEAFHMIVIDEAARIKEDVWLDTIQPTLADYGGRALLISTPKGRNWFWREWQSADGVEKERWQAPSCDNPNPRIKQAYEQARTKVPERTFLQEWDAQFVDDAGLVFRRVMAAITAQEQMRALPDHQYVMGIDFAKHEDFTVISVIDTTENALVYMDRFNQIDYPLQLSRIRTISSMFMPDAIIAEVNSMGEPLIDQLQLEGLPMMPFKTTNASKASIIESLQLAFEQEEIKILNNQTLIDELHVFAMDKLPSGLTRYSAPAGAHDDCVMSLAFAWHGACCTVGDWEFV